MTDAAPVGRLAPTPSGPMHLGNAFSALLAWLSARSRGARLVLRFEDLDPDRTSRAYAEGIERDLDFLGIDWDEGGFRGGPRGPYFQGERAALYDDARRRLDALGLTYPCFCSRAQLHAADAPHASDGDVIYDGRCRALTAREIAERTRQKPPALRLRVPDARVELVDRHYGRYGQNLATDCGDFILRRSDGVYSYQLAVVVDDARMGVTEVVRGRDLLSSAPRQTYLYRLLGWEPPTFAHVPLLLAPDGRRLSKRDGDAGLDALRARGRSGRDVVGRLAFLAGLQSRPEPASPRELLPTFDWARVPTDDIRIPKELF